jgi:cell division septum initiation protein DivIVA
MQVLVEQIIELENQYIEDNEVLKKCITNLKNEIENYKKNEISLNNTISDLKTINKKSSSNEMWVQLNDKNKEIEFLKKELDFYKGKNFRTPKNEPFVEKEIVNIEKEIVNIEKEIVNIEEVIINEPVIRKKKIIKVKKIKKTDIEE